MYIGYAWYAAATVASWFAVGAYNYMSSPNPSVVCPEWVYYSGGTC